MSNMNKAKVKERVEQIQSEVIRDLEQAYARDATSADIDETETKDPEDFSHQGELNEMARRIELRLKNSQDELKYLQKLGDDVIESVGEGALVETDKYVFYVAIATHPFKIDGKTVVGISTEAPIYLAMRDKQAGESFVFADNTYKILNVN